MSNICTCQLFRKRQGVSFKAQLYLALTNLFLHRTGETNVNIESLQPYPVVASDALLEVCEAVIGALRSLDEHMSQTNTCCVPECFYQSVHCCLIRYILVRICIAKCFTALLLLRIKACCGFLLPSAGFERANLGSICKHNHYITEDDLHVYNSTERIWKGFGGPLLVGTKFSILALS
jgi:hypothetical protein